MSYLPKSQIATKVANPNEFEYKSSGKPYVGYYIETSKGVLYAGANNILKGPIIIPIKKSSNKIQGFSVDVEVFNIMKENIKDFLSNTIPIPSIKKYPSESDYINGFFIRYFSRRINGAGYQEVEKEVFESIKGKNKIYDHNLYEVGSIRWNLKGNVFKFNALLLKELERRWKNISYLFPIFDEFAIEPFKNQEDLYTKGEELYYGDSTEYVGSYHIHTTKGPMKGAYHTETDHPKLYYTNELPTPLNMSYEDFMTGYPPKLSPSPEFPFRADREVLSSPTNTPTTRGNSAPTSRSGY
tara:strand:+ start:3911 stop:4804 length:894 start_codon:yes stop_codon:yes gene_type:complete